MTWAVKFEEVSKRYRGGGPRYASLRHDIAAAARRVAGFFSHREAEQHGKLALNCVSFEVEQGQSFAIIGPNGAGKTTALRLLSRISYPTTGRVKVRGRVGALIEVGSGVHPELTARENIWLYGQILGMSKADIRQRFDEIVEFAELDEALETPVKMYSSGMQLRLGFAVASHLDPDVFVVDEALAVGDAGFQAKCVERMTTLVREGRTLLFVSHNLAAVESVCTRGLFLLDGRVHTQGSVRSIIERYIGWVEDQRLRPGRLGHSRGVVRCISSSCHGLDGQERYDFSSLEGVEIRLQFVSDHQVDKPYVNLAITDGRPGYLVHCSMLTDGFVPSAVSTRWECRCRIESLPLKPRLYQVYCDVYSGQGPGQLMDWLEVAAFRVAGDSGLGPMGAVHAATSGAVEVKYEWQVTPEIGAGTLL